jgi:hypothetical protein
MIEITPEMLQPRVTDDDKDTITVTHLGTEVRSWHYENDSQRRTKMLQAREYIEGFCDGQDHMKKTTLTVKGIHLRKRLREAIPDNVDPEIRDMIVEKFWPFGSAG